MLFDLKDFQFKNIFSKFLNFIDIIVYKAWKIDQQYQIGFIIT